MRTFLHETLHEKGVVEHEAEVNLKPLFTFEELAGTANGAEVQGWM
jgi:hypothetical protein